jgi:hypothetical protein
VLAEA